MPIVGYFYFGQDERLENDAAVMRGVDEATKWLLKRLPERAHVEIANECDNRKYEQPLVQAPRAHVLIELAKSITSGGRRLPVSVSFNGGVIPTPAVVSAADYLLLHGNGVADPDRIAGWCGRPATCAAIAPCPSSSTRTTTSTSTSRAITSSRPSACTSWGYFDFRMKGEGFEEGYQSVPVQWGITSARKRGFFSLLA